MSVEDNKALARRFREAMDRRESPDEYLAPACIAHFPGIPPLDREQVKGMIGAFYSAFPDLRHEVVDHVESVETIALELRVTGTHSGPMRTPAGEIPPTGKKVLWESVDFIKIEGGKIRSWHVYQDQVAFLTQLGLMPEPAQA